LITKLLYTKDSVILSNQIAMVDDPFHLERFLKAQEDDYEFALAEIQAGEKRSHWIWYIFPQIDELAFSSTSKYYAIRSLEEARAYLAHPVLGPRLLACAEALLNVRGRSAAEIFGFPDDVKVRSCATLFAQAASAPSVFDRILDKYYNGERDPRTLALLGL
jgi:uncharacterized protein (DUF1810 family)